MSRSVCLFLCLLCFLSWNIQAQSTSIKIADNVYVIRHQPAPNGFPQGNTTVIIGNREVFVVDPGYWASTAREDIRQIRTWTNKPVRYVLNTHWHHDHCFNNAVYADSFPGVGIIAHEETKADMDLYVGTALARLVDGINKSKVQLQSGKNETGKTLNKDEQTEIEQSIAQREIVVNEWKPLTYQSPSITFTQDMNFDIGGREIYVRYFGRGNTTGDAIVYLPKEKIVMTGDLLVHPMPYTYDGYPSEWIKTLDRIADLNPETIVPGHGEVFRDKKYLTLVTNWMKSAVTQMNERLKIVGPAEFRSFEEVKGHVDLSEFRDDFAGNDQTLGDRFDQASALLIKLVFKEAALR
ncbi:MBL fold metallo-hydrolase [bacterium]|nr:MBL fold metallo-hydrolase [bacterium]